MNAVATQVIVQNFCPLSATSPTFRPWPLSAVTPLLIETVTIPLPTKHVIAAASANIMLIVTIGLIGLTNATTPNKTEMAVSITENT